jgi:hypothetical protein
MQPEAIPFDTTRQSFALVIFLMIGIVFVIRLVIRFTPAFQERIALWIKTRKLGEKMDESSARERRGGFAANDVGMEEDMGDVPV